MHQEKSGNPGPEFNLDQIRSILITENTSRGKKAARPRKTIHPLKSVDHHLQQRESLFFSANTQPDNQGDQIGRIFAYWAIVFFGQFFN
jgi:hypothetical protein